MILIVASQIIAFIRLVFPPEDRLITLIDIALCDKDGAFRIRQMNIMKIKSRVQEWSEMIAECCGSVKIVIEQECALR